MYLGVKWIGCDLKKTQHISPQLRAEHRERLNMAPNATFLLSLTSSSLPISLFNHNLHTQFRSSHKLFVSFSKAPTFSFTASAATVDKARVVHGGENAEKETFRQPRPTEVYICNLPRSCDVQHLLHLFNPHGTVLSAQVFYGFFHLFLLLFSLNYSFFF